MKLSVIVACVLATALLLLSPSALFVAGNQIASSEALPELLSSPTADNSTITFRPVSAHPNWSLLPSRTICGIPLQPTHKTKTGNLLLFRRRRVASGRLAFPREVPGIAIIYLKDPTELEGDYTGGNGVLISSRYVLTTASLIKFRMKNGNVLHAVGFRTNKRSETYHSYRIEKVIIHDDYEFGSQTNDIALLRLVKDVDFNSETNPLCLPDMPDDSDNDVVGGTGSESDYFGLQSQWSACRTSNLVGIGIGKMLERLQSLPVYMNYIEMKTRPNFHCDRVYSRELGKMGPGKICVSACLGDNAGLCGTGDMSSPLMNSHDLPNGQKQYTLYGLASHYVECGIQSVPALYTNISYYVPWILDNLRQ